MANRVLSVSQHRNYYRELYDDSNKYIYNDSENCIYIYDATAITLSDTA